MIGYYFASPVLLETALTHSSLRAPDRECNERLEFLGDSILGLVITEELYHLLPDQSEGELTRIKSAVVSRSALLDASLRLGLPQYAEFARGVSRRDRLPASVVANLVEAVIGAIYLDAGYYPAREFVLRHMGTAIDDELHDRGAKNYKSLLQHEVQQSISVTPTYRTLEADGPDHAKEFVVAAIIRGQEWGRATGPTKKDAEQEAARLALEAWQRRGRGRRRRRGRKSTPKAVVEAPAEIEVPAPEKPAIQSAPVVVHEESAADDPAPPPASRSPKRRSRKRPPRAPEPVTPEPHPEAEPEPEPEPEAARAPEKPLRPAPVEPAPPPAPEPAPEPEPVKAAGDFGAGIDVDDAPRHTETVAESRQVEAPSKKAAPETEKPDDDAGFGAGL